LWKEHTHNDWNLPGGKAERFEIPTKTLSRELIEEGLSDMDKNETFPLSTGRWIVSRDMGWESDIFVSDLDPTWWCSLLFGQHNKGVGCFMKLPLIEEAMMKGSVRKDVGRQILDALVFYKESEIDSHIRQWDISLSLVDWGRYSQDCAGECVVAGASKGRSLGDDDTIAEADGTSGIGKRP
jgi:hypothetical protein